MFESQSFRYWWNNIVLPLRGADIVYRDFTHGTRPALYMMYSYKLKSYVLCKMGLKRIIAYLFVMYAEYLHDRQVGETISWSTRFPDLTPLGSASAGPPNTIGWVMEKPVVIIH